MRKQYTDCASNIHILSVPYMAIVVICNMVAAIPPVHILGLDAVSLLLGHCAILRHVRFARAKRLLSSFAIIFTSERKKTARQWPKRRSMASRLNLKNVVLWRNASNHIAYFHNSHTAHSVCILLVQYVLCSNVYPVHLVYINYSPFPDHDYDYAIRCMANQ